MFPIKISCVAAAIVGQKALQIIPHLIKLGLLFEGFR
jgi:hypothetical protein